MRSRKRSSPRTTILRIQESGGHIISRSANVDRIVMMMARFLVSNQLLMTISPISKTPLGSMSQFIYMAN